MMSLFTYGTLQEKEVQDSLFGRILKGTPQKLIGYDLRKIQIEEEFGIAEYPIIVATKNPEDCIEGITYNISEQELTVVDTYEGMHYKRIKVTLHSNQIAWVYTAADIITTP